MGTTQWQGPGPSVSPTRPLDLPALIVSPQVDAELDSTLRDVGVHVSWCSDGGEALIHFGRTSPPVVVLPPVLTGIACADVVSAMRRSASTLILIAIGDGEASLAGPAFMAGATAMVQRPFRAAELVGQILAAAPVVESPTRLTFGPLSVDLLAHSVHVDEQELASMPPKEFGLLLLLMRHGDRVVTLKQIREHLWPHEEMPPEKSVAVHVRRLRNRLPAPLTVRTIRGLGYRLTMS